MSATAHVASLAAGGGSRRPRPASPSRPVSPVRAVHPRVERGACDPAAQQMHPQQQAQHFHHHHEQEQQQQQRRLHSAGAVGGGAGVAADRAGAGHYHQRNQRHQYHRNHHHHYNNNNLEHKLLYQQHQHHHRHHQHHQQQQQIRGQHQPMQLMHQKLPASAMACISSAPAANSIADPSPPPQPPPGVRGEAVAGDLGSGATAPAAAAVSSAPAQLAPPSQRQQRELQQLQHHQQHQHQPRLEDYVLDRVIGSGGSSTVVRAAPVGDPTAPVALKAVEKSALSRRAHRYLAREIAVHRAIPRHPHVVDLHAVFENKVGVYLVMELLRGSDLYAAMRRERRGLDEPVALTIVAQVLDALAHIHALGISHRDVKLENIVLTRKVSLRQPSTLADIRVKLVDFGLACVRHPNASAAERLSREKCGTLRYAAPEVFADAPYSPERADLWSVGIVLYSILAHRHPYAANSSQDVVHMIESTDLRFDGHAFSAVSSDTIELIRSLLAKDPGLRPDAPTALAETRRILHSLSVDLAMMPSSKPAVYDAGDGVGGSSVQSGSDVAPSLRSSDTRASPGVTVSQIPCSPDAFGAESTSVLDNRSVALARAPHALDAMSSAMSAEPAGKSQNKLVVSPNSSSDDPAPAPFNLGEVVKGLFEVFQRTGSPSRNRRSGSESTVLLDHSDSDETHHSSDLEQETTSFTTQSVDDQPST